MPPPGKGIICGMKDRAGTRKVRLMSVWVIIGIVVLVVGFFTSPWIALLGACIIGSTPVWFTLRMALATPRRPPKPRYDALSDDINRLIEQVPRGPDTPEKRPQRHKR
jgi:hypothetical protein